MAHIPAYAVGLVGAMNQISWPSEMQRVLTERIVRTRCDDFGKIGFFFVDRPRRIPRGPNDLFSDPCAAERGRTPLHADTVLVYSTRENHQRDRALTNEGIHDHWEIKRLLRPYG